MDFPEETIQAVLKNFYADDCLKSVGTTEEAINILLSLCKLLALVGFRLTKWISNDRRVLEPIPVEQRAKGVKNLDLDHSFGSFVVKRGQSQLKRYGCLFTCLTMQAIHLEKLDSLEADSFINALVRFCARRGVPEKVRSDNGTNFVGGEKELRETMRSWKEDSKAKAHFLQKEIKWEFNPPAASHMGGIWERQIRTVRKVLNVILREQIVDDKRLSTLFCEVESIVNGRPLTVLSDDLNDETPLTPNHLLLLCGGPHLLPGQFDQSDIYGRRWRHVQFLSDQFWKRWVCEYLPTLQLRHKWLRPKRNLQDGDVVLIMDENTPWKNWPLRRIIQTFPGKDGLVRAARVKTSWSILTRSVTKLCLLESAGGEM